MVMNGEKYVNVDGIRTRYFEKGNGQPLVLFHSGEFGSDDWSNAADCWGLNFDGLAQRFHVYAVDKLGQGYTDNPRRDEDYTMAAVVRHAHSFLEVMRLNNVNLVGHSRGGYLAGRLTLEHPELVKSCIIVDSNTLAPGVGRDAEVTANPPKPLLSRESQKWVIERYSYGHEHITDDWLDAMVRIGALPKYQEAVAKMIPRGLRNRRFLPEMAKEKDEPLAWIRDGRFKTPTLVVWGYNDPTAPLSMGQALFELVAASAPRSQMHIFNKAGHFSFREHPREFNDLLSGFIQHC